MDKPSNRSHLQDIEGSLSSHLSGRTVVVGVSGSVAALEVPRLVRLLMRHGARVHCFLTPSACELVTPTSLHWCTGHPVVTEISGRCEHLEYFGHRGKADLFLLAPTTANTLGKVALGLDDNAVTTAAITALGQGVPVLLAPGMHEPMLHNPAVQRNLALASEMGVEILQPSLAEGKAKMMGVEEIGQRVLRRLGPGDLKGRRVLLSGGPTREFLDPARCMTNPSSGLSAIELAGEAFRRGAQVKLVYGPGRHEPPSWIETERVVSTEEMAEAVKRALLESPVDDFLGVAAVCDFRPEEVSSHKISTEEGELTLRLVTTPKVIDLVRRTSPSTRLVAFKAASGREDEELARVARPYLEKGRADVVVANSISTPNQGFDSPENRYLVFPKQGAPVSLGPDSKARLATLLWDTLNCRA